MEYLIYKPTYQSYHISGPLWTYYQSHETFHEADFLKIIIVFHPDIFPVHCFISVFLQSF